MNELALFVKYLRKQSHLVDRNVELSRETLRLSNQLADLRTRAAVTIAAQADEIQKRDDEISRLRSALRARDIQDDEETQIAEWIGPTETPLGEQIDGGGELPPGIYIVGNDSEDE